MCAQVISLAAGVYQSEQGKRCWKKNYLCKERAEHGKMGVLI